MNRSLYPLVVLCMLMSLPVPARADWVTANVPAGNYPQAMAVNLLTNKIYVANRNSNDVTVIDGADNSTVTVPVGTQPRGIAVNLATNKIYVANASGGGVTEIDGITNATAGITAGMAPVAVAVNAATNKIYVANYGKFDGTLGSVTVIDGATGATTTVGARAKPMAVAINPVTNKIYVANYGDGTVTVIDGATNDTATVVVGTEVRSLAVNPVTNKIYVVNYLGNSVTVIDGATNDTATAAVGNHPFEVAVNPVTNKIYVANLSASNVIVIDGESGATTTVAAGSYPYAVAVNPITNKIYVANGNTTVTVIDGATNTPTTLAAVHDTRAVAVNPVTNKIYVANSDSNKVTVIDGSTNSTVTLATWNIAYDMAANPVTNRIYVANKGYSSVTVTVIDGATNTGVNLTTAGIEPHGVDLNPVTNRIYVANHNSDNVTVINGADNSLALVPAGTGPWAVAVNPVTNRIYVANSGSNDVTVIDGTDNSTTTVAAGTEPQALAVNPVTNRIYVANTISHDVTVINGNTNRTVTVPTGYNPMAVAVNPVTNKIYVATNGSNGVTIIDGATDSTTGVGTGSAPWDVAVNPVTNKIYVSNWESDNVTVIDGTDNSTATVAVGSQPQAVAVDPLTNKIYVANSGSNNVTVIDGATNNTSTVAADEMMGSVIVNPVTGKAYAGSFFNATVTLIDPAPVIDSGIRAVVDSLPGNVSYQTQPVLTGRGVNRWSPNRTDMMGIINGWMAGQNVWNWAAGPFDSTSSDSIGWTYDWGTDSLLWGENYLKIVPLESQASTANNLGQGTPLAGNLLTCPVYYLDSIPPTQVSLLWPADNLLLADSSVSLGWTRASDNYGVGRYQVQCAADSGFSLILRDTVISDTTGSLVFSPVDTLNFWRVRAVDACGNQGEYSPVWQFEIDVTSPAVPTLLTPANSAWLATDTAFCTWSAVSKKTKDSPVYYVLKAYLLSDTINPIAVDTTFLTADTLLVSQDRYRWLVEAYDEAGNPPGISGYYSFGYDKTPPSTIAQISPADSSTTNQDSITFCWHPSTDAVSGIREYALVYAYDESFTSGLAETTLTDTSITLVLADTAYCWMVEARDSAGNAGVSYVWYLNMDTHNPDVPSLSSPADNYWTEDTSIIFAWGEVAKKASPAAKASEVSYVIQLDTSNIFATPIIEDTTGILLDTFNLSEGQYYWRVMAFDLAGNFGTYSSSWTFGIDTTAPDIQYVLNLPDDASAPYGPYEVTSKVYDLSGIKTAYMFTQTNGGAWDSTAMFSASDSLRDSIPEINPATDETLSVSYYLKVTDMLDHQSVSGTYSFQAIGPSGVAGKPESSLPTIYALQNAYPNPSRGQTTFKYQLPKESRVSLTVYNVVGQAVKRFDLGAQPAGYHQINWNDKTLPNGVYIYQLKAGTFSSTKKLMIVR